MRKLTVNQMQFLLMFFVNEKYAGWKNVATKLLETGKCIVAGTKCIWDGGIGNFIEVSPEESAVDCSLYEFDLNEFLKSGLYEHAKESYVEQLVDERDELEAQLSDKSAEMQDIINL